MQRETWNSLRAENEKFVPSASPIDSRLFVPAGRDAA